MTAGEVMGPDGWEEEPNSVPGKRWLTVYAKTRHYGGPEEGGWWYDWERPVVSVPVYGYQSDEEIEERREALRLAFDYLIEGDIGSVAGGQAMWVALEDIRQEFATTERPYYE